MPPPRLPKAAQGLATIVADTVIGITGRQETSVSFSDVSRGVTAALSKGLSVVDYTFVTKVCDFAHANAQHGEGHNDGFCRGCAAVHEAVNAALIENSKIKDERAGYGPNRGGA